MSKNTDKTKDTSSGEGSNTALCYAKDNPLHACQRAIKYCQQYGIKKGTKRWRDVSAAYSTGYHNGLNEI